MASHSAVILRNDGGASRETASVGHLLAKTVNNKGVEDDDDGKGDDAAEDELGHVDHNDGQVTSIQASGTVSLPGLWIERVLSRVEVGNILHNTDGNYKCNDVARHFRVAPSFASEWRTDAKKALGGQGYQAISALIGCKMEEEHQPVASYRRNVISEELEEHPFRETNQKEAGVPESQVSHVDTERRHSVAPRTGNNDAKKITHNS